MKFEDFGYNNIIQQSILENNLSHFEAEIIGNFRFSAESRIDFPAVGEWIAQRNSILQKAFIGEFASSIHAEIKLKNPEGMIIL